MTDKAVVLTGACGLIGRALAAAFRDRGTNVALVDVGGARPEKAAREAGGGTLGFACDVTKAGEVADLVRRVVNRRIQCRF